MGPARAKIIKSQRPAPKQSKARYGVKFSRKKVRILSKRDSMNSRIRTYFLEEPPIFGEGGANLFRSCQKNLPCLVITRQGFVWFVNFPNFPNKIG